jgi:hypothetical protein
MSTMHRTFDWKPVFDEQSLSYPIRSLVPKDIEIKTTMWQEGTVLDQGSEGACVGFGWTAELLAAPLSPEKQPPENRGNEMAYSFYKRAQKVDEWPGEEYSGTSVLAGAKVMLEDQYFQEYRWCFSIEDLRDAIISSGPVVIGIPWYSEMYTTKIDGFVKMGGELVGGHCLTVTGYNAEKNIFRWRNSWGRSYGINGSAFISYDNLRQLVSERAEMCIPINRIKSLEF